MLTSRTAKVQADIDKARAKLADQLARIKELENKHTEYENMEIIDLVRGLKIPMTELAAALQSVKSGTAPVPAPALTSAQVEPKSKAATIMPETTTTDKEAETE